MTLQSGRTALFVWAVVVLLVCRGASAETIFVDDFSDGSAVDGSPTTWVTLPNWAGDMDASTGDLVLSKAADVSPITGPADLQLGDTSIRARVRLAGPAQSIVVGARASTVTDKGYSAGINVQSGVLFIARIEGPFGTTPTTFDFIPTDLNPLEEDVMFQFDAIGNRLQFWAWRPGEPMPSEPQLSAVDDVLTTGVPYIGWGIGTVDNPGPGIFRSVELATTPIPEPSSAAMASLGLAMLSLFASRRRQRVRS